MYQANGTLTGRGEQSNCEAELRRPDFSIRKPERSTRIQKPDQSTQIQAMLEPDLSVKRSNVSACSNEETFAYKIPQ